MKYERLFNLYRCDLNYGFVKGVAKVTVQLPSGNIFQSVYTINEHIEKNYIITKTDLSFREWVKHNLLVDTYRSIKQHEAKEYIKTLSRQKQKLIKYL